MKTPVAIVCGALVAPVAQAVPAQAGHAFADREASFEVALPPAAAFPLFEPWGEKAWVEGWQPVFASAGDAELHNGSVFTVRLAHHGETAIDSVWTVTRYEPPRLVEYRNVLPGVRATRIVVACEPAATGTRVTVHYTYHGLSEAGDRQISQITVEKFESMIRGWGDAIAACLQRGTPASP